MLGQGLTDDWEPRTVSEQERDWIKALLWAVSCGCSYIMQQGRKGGTLGCDNGAMEVGMAGTNWKRKGRINNM